MLKEMEVIWNKFQNQELKMEDVTEEELIALREALTKKKRLEKKLTEEENRALHVTNLVGNKAHEQVTSALYDAYYYI